MSSYLQRLRKTDPQVIAEAEEIIEEYVRDSYASYRTDRQFDSRRKEPSITLGTVAGYLRQHSIAGHCPFGTERGNKPFTRWTYNVARAALGRLVRSKKLRTSLGVGLNGQEARCYEPGEVS